MKSAHELLIQQGFILFPEVGDNLIKANQAFFAARVIVWLREKGTDPDFNLQAYLVALSYYKLGLADLKFVEDELLYRYRGVSLEGVEGEFSKDDARPLGEYHRPSDPAPNSGGPSDNI